jgi:hypothetical protein
VAGCDGAGCGNCIIGKNGPTDCGGVAGCDGAACGNGMIGRNGPIGIDVAGGGGDGAAGDNGNIGRTIDDD